MLAVEDIDFGGHICHPPSAAYDRYVELYCQTARARECDPCIGPRLPSLLQSAGFSDVIVGIVQPSGISGEVKLIAAITFDAIAEAALKSGLDTSENLGATSDALYEFARQKGSFMSLPRIFQCSGAGGTDGSSREQMQPALPLHVPKPLKSFADNLLKKLRQEIPPESPFVSAFGFHIFVLYTSGS